MGDTQNTPATDRGDTQVGVVAEAVQNSTDNTHVGFRALLAMDHCHVELRCAPDSHTVRPIAATVDEQKPADETMAADPDGTYVLGVSSVVVVDN